jgi:site-specific recombinase XerD
VSRHTFATLSLTYGVDLYTISKLLGHSNIRVTQVYADIISEKKREAVDAIPSIG